MTAIAFDDLSSETSQNNSSCIFQNFKNPVVLSGLILTLIGLGLGIITIFVRKLHSTFTISISFIVITVIFTTVGFTLLISCAEVYEIIIALPVASGLATLAFFMGIKLEDEETKFKMILFVVCCVFAGIGFILFILGLILNDYVLQGDGWICWCCVTFIVIIFTKDYLDRHREHFTETYTMFVLFYEYLVLIINSQLSLNLLIDCKCSNGKKPNETIV